MFQTTNQINIAVHGVSLNLLFAGKNIAILDYQMVLRNHQISSVALI